MPLSLSGQTLGQLMSLGESVEEALESGEGDPEYWEAVQKRLRIHKAKAQVWRTRCVGLASSQVLEC